MRVLAFLFAGSLLFAQLESNTVTVTASRTLASQPDQVVFTVSAFSSGPASLEDVVASLQGSGITAAQFSGISSTLAQGSTSTLLWLFDVSVPLGKFKETAAMFAALPRTALFRVAGAKASQPPQCPVSDLIADARAHAQKLAVAAGLALGPILALSSASSSGTIGGVIASAPTLAIRTGDFTFDTTTTNYASFLIGGISATLPPIQPLSCYLTVKFGATRY